MKKLICPYCKKRIETKAACKKCGHKWEPRKSLAPEICPKCKRKNWRECFGDKPE